MAHACQHLMALGYHRVVLVGTDLPTLSPDQLRQAFSLLTAQDLVLGPTADGGYYLIGMKRFMPELFQGIPWSTSQVFALTQQKASGLGLSVGLVPPLRDLDTPSDLEAFIQLIHRTAHGGSLSSRTGAVLQVLARRLLKREGTYDRVP